MAFVSGGTELPLGGWPFSGRGDTLRMREGPGWRAFPEVSWREKDKSKDEVAVGLDLTDHLERSEPFVVPNTYTYTSE